MFVFLLYKTQSLILTLQKTVLGFVFSTSAQELYISLMCCQPGCKEKKASMTPHQSLGKTHKFIKIPMGVGME